jgi:hypothetical protein
VTFSGFFHSANRAPFRSRASWSLAGAAEDGPLNRRSETLSEKKTYRTWTVAQKLEIVLAGLRA